MFLLWVSFCLSFDWKYCIYESSPELCLQDVYDCIYDSSNFSDFYKKRYSTSYKVSIYVADKFSTKFNIDNVTGFPNLYLFGLSSKSSLSFAPQNIKRLNIYARSLIIEGNFLSATDYMTFEIFDVKNITLKSPFGKFTASANYINADTYSFTNLAINPSYIQLILDFQYFCPSEKPISVGGMNDIVFLNIPNNSKILILKSNYLISPPSSKNISFVLSLTDFGGKIRLENNVKGGYLVFGSLVSPTFSIYKRMTIICKASTTLEFLDCIYSQNSAFATIQYEEPIRIILRGEDIPLQILKSNSFLTLIAAAPECGISYATISVSLLKVMITEIDDTMRRSVTFSIVTMDNNSMLISDSPRISVNFKQMIVNGSCSLSGSGLFYLPSIIDSSENCTINVVNLGIHGKGFSTTFPFKSLANIDINSKNIVFDNYNHEMIPIYRGPTDSSFFLGSINSYQNLICSSTNLSKSLFYFNWDEHSKFIRGVSSGSTLFEPVIRNFPLYDCIGLSLTKNFSLFSNSFCFTGNDYDQCSEFAFIINTSSPILLNWEDYISKDAARITLWVDDNTPCIDFSHFVGNSVHADISTYEIHYPSLSLQCHSLDRLSNLILESIKVSCNDSQIVPFMIQYLSLIDMEFNQTFLDFLYKCQINVLSADITSLRRIDTAKLSTLELHYMHDSGTIEVFEKGLIIEDFPIFANKIRLSFYFQDNTIYCNQQNGTIPIIYVDNNLQNLNIIGQWPPNNYVYINSLNRIAYIKCNISSPPICFNHTFRHIMYYTESNNIHFTASSFISAGLTIVSPYHTKVYFDKLTISENGIIKGSTVEIFIDNLTILNHKNANLKMNITNTVEIGKDPSIIFFPTHVEIPNRIVLYYTMHKASEVNLFSEWKTLNEVVLIYNGDPEKDIKSIKEYNDYLKIGINLICGFEYNCNQTNVTFASESIFPLEKKLLKTICATEESTKINCLRLVPRTPSPRPSPIIVNETIVILIFISIIVLILGVGIMFFISKYKSLSSAKTKPYNRFI